MPATHWVVRVTEQPVLIGDLPYIKTFDFYGETAEVAALECWAKAERHGLSATIKEVMGGASKQPQPLARSGGDGADCPGY